MTIQLILISILITKNFIIKVNNLFKFPFLISDSHFTHNKIEYTFLLQSWSNCPLPFPTNKFYGYKSYSFNC